MDNLSKFVETLQYLMIQKNLKPVDVHNDTKISLATIYDWLKKAAMPKLKNLIILSDYFQCSLEYLIWRTENNHFHYGQQMFSQRLRVLLNKNKISIRKLSDETKIAKSSISYFLNGSTEPLLDNLIKLADYFDCTLDYLVGREN